MIRKVTTLLLISLVITPIYAGYLPELQGQPTNPYATFFIILKHPLPPTVTQSQVDDFDFVDSTYPDEKRITTIILKHPQLLILLNWYLHTIKMEHTGKLIIL